MPKTRSAIPIFLALLAAVYVFIGFIGVLPLRPQSVHQWAQCDRASVALNFAHDSFNIFKPRVHNIGNGTGITGMEFPLVNYLAGMLYRLLGFHECLYRIIMILLLTLGLAAAFKTAILFLADPLYSGIAVLLMFLSPVLVYYTPNFLPDTAGLGMILCAWFCFFMYSKKPKHKYLYLVILFASLACLVKITNLVSVAAMIILSFNSLYISNKKKELHEPGSDATRLLMLLIPVILSVSWYAYAAWLSNTTGSDVFLLKHKPITNSEQLVSVLEEIRKIWFNQYYSKYMYFFVGISLIVILMYRKLINSTLFKTTMLLWLGNICYFLFMMAQFPEHDYYIISMLPVIFFQCVAIFSVLQHFLRDKKISAVIAKSVAIALVIHGIWFSKHIFNDRYDLTSWMRSNPVYDRYYAITGFARNLGLKPGDRVLSAFDNSPDITLYLMDQKGVTGSPEADMGAILKAYQYKIDYLVLNDSLLISSPAFTHLKPEFLGTRNNIYFYRIRNLK